MFRKNCFAILDINKNVCPAIRFKSAWFFNLWVVTIGGKRKQKYDTTQFKDKSDGIC